jgi:acyl-CoA dehydrogenase
MKAVEEDDLDRFDRAFFGHVGFVATTAVRSLLLGLSRGRLELGAPGSATLRPLCQRLSRASASFALVSDASMATLGGGLKRREKITGRLADALAWLYIGSAVVERFATDGEPANERAFVQWTAEHALERIDTALAGVLRNLPARPAAWALAPLVFPLGRRERGPDDALGSAIARALLDDEAARTHLTEGIFLPPDDEVGLGHLEAALRSARPALAVEAKLRHAVAQGRLDHAPGDELTAAALAAGIVTAEEVEQLSLAREAREEVIRVDAFDAETFRRLHR